MPDPGVGWRRDLLRSRAVRWLVSRRWFPSGLQALALLALVALIVAGWGQTGESRRYTNVASWTVWVIWWPFVVISALFAGRLWCGICPLRFVADGCGALGPGRAPPGWIEKHRAGPTLAMVVALVALHSTVVSFDVQHTPHRTAIYLLALVLLSAAVGVAWGRGAFCRVLCPLASFFGAYSRISPTELRARDATVCVGCGARAPVTPCRRACPSNLSVPGIDSNEDCLLCLECVKACPNANIRFGVRGFCGDTDRGVEGSLARTLLVAVLLGIALQELGEEWERFGALVSVVPAWISGLGIPAEVFGGYAWLETLWLNLALPLGLLWGAGVASRLLSRRGTAWRTVEMYGIAFVPLIFGVHLAKLLNKLNERVGHAPGIVSDPLGTGAVALASGAHPPAAVAPRLLPGPVMGWLLMGLVALGLWMTVRALARISRRTYPREPSAARASVAPFIALAVACGAVFLISIWRWLIG